ncbi:MAG: deoxynucleoside kinase [Muribaculaceae bacterium]|jgi:Deoxynucleoside kinases|nr:deoxynucleoside kinase [Muribaculaceae bacterium]MBQ4005453.1 deoxynucleoside kinase [Muribaculaceae bacterium]
MHIAVAGNIGCGKTTLTTMLAKRYGWQPRFESVTDNPYLTDYYADMKRWAFNTQVYFLSRHFAEVVEISHTKDVIVQDRTIFEDANIFAPNLHEQGLMSDRDWNNYKDLFDLMISMVKKPDLLIYIRASIATLVAQIQKRGRDYEQSIRIDYLQGLEERYERWIASYDGPLLIVDGDTCKFGDNPEDFVKVTDRIDTMLFGLFPMI